MFVLATLAALCLPAGFLRADGLKSAQVSRIFNEVKLLPENEAPRPAAVADTVTGKAAVQTGSASRTELTFSDKTLTRLGANSYFSFVNGTRNMNLGSGTMLLQVPKGAGGAEIHTAAVTAAITGTTLMVEYNPKSYSKIIVLEGTVRVYLTGRIGESILVHAGQMVIVPPASKVLPEPVSVDLKVLYATSGLINDFGPLASNRLIDHEIVQQKKDIDGGKLAGTNLFIVGRGTEVQEGHLTYVNGVNQQITARQGPREPVSLNEQPRISPPLESPTPTVSPRPPVTPTPPVVTPTPPVVTPTPPVVTPTPPVVTPTPPVVTPTPPVVTPTPPVVTPTPPVVTPTPPPVSPTPNPKNGALPLIANNAANNTLYAIDTSSVILTDPFITTQGRQDSGRIYRGGTAVSPSGADSPDGLPSSYLLGATGGPSVYDTRIGFDTQFGTVGDIGAFKFSVLALTGQPALISTANGPTNLALIAVTDIQDSLGQPTTLPNTLDLGGLNQVLLATQNGPIVFNNGLSFLNTGTTVPTLTLYARGGTLNIGANAAFNLPGSVINFYSDTSLLLNGNVGSANAPGAGAITAFSGGPLTLGGFLHVSGDIVATTTPEGAGVLTVDSNASVNAAGDFNATSSGFINVFGTINAGGDTRLVSATGLQVVNQITTGGNLRLRADTGDITTDPASLLNVGGTFTANAATGHLTLNGTVGANDANPDAVTPTAANLTAGLTLTLSGDLAATDSVAISSTGGAVTQTGGNVRALGATSQGTPTSGSVTVTTANGDINLNAGTLSGNTITVSTTGGNVTQLADHTLSTVAGDLSVTSTNGSINLGGIVESGGAVLARSGGLLQLTAAKVSSSNGANVSLTSANGNIIIDEDSTVNLDGGAFSANTSQALLIDGTIGHPEFGRAARPGQINSVGNGNPDSATGMAGNGITVGGAIATGFPGTGSTGVDGITLTATGGNFSLGGALQAFSGGITLAAATGAMTIDGYAFGNGDVSATSSGDMAVTGTLNASGSILATSNNGPLTTGLNSYVEATGDVTLSGSSSLNVGGNVYADNGVLSLNASGPVDVTGNGTAGTSFNAQSSGGSLTIDGGLNVTGVTGAISSLSARDTTNGAVAINGTVSVGTGELDIRAGTTFVNDAENSLIVSNHIELIAGTTVTLDLGNIRTGDHYLPSLLNVTAATINGTDGSGQEIRTVNLTATGPISLADDYSTNTVQGASLTLAPNATFSVTNLNTTAGTGPVVIGDGVDFTLRFGGSSNVVGPVTLDGSPTLRLNGSLTINGALAVTASPQTPAIYPTSFTSDPVALTVTGNIALGAGTIFDRPDPNFGPPGGAVTTNGTLTTTGDIVIRALNAFGGFSVGSLAAGTVTLQDASGNTATNPPGATVTGQVLPYTPDVPSVFTLGRFTAAGLTFNGDTVGTNGSGGSLTLNIKSNFGIRTGGGTGNVGSADFGGSTEGSGLSGENAGNGGSLVVNTTANPAVNAPGNIVVQTDAAGNVPVLTAAGGTIQPITNGITGSGGAGGTLSLNAAGAFTAASKTSFTASGGGFAITDGSTYTGGGPTNGGDGGTIRLTAGTDVTLAGVPAIVSPSPSPASPVTINVQGGTVSNSNSGTAGHGGTVTLQAGGVASLNTVNINARGGDNASVTLAGDAPGGTISVTSTQTSSPAASTVVIMGSSLLADNGLVGNRQDGTGGTINFTSLDASSPPVGTFTPPAAIVVSNSIVQVSREEVTSTPPPLSYGSRVGGVINVVSARRTGPGISVQDSSQLLALVNSTSTVANTGGKINLTTSGANIAVMNNSKVRATGANSAVTLDTGTTGGTITVDGSTLSTVSGNNALGAGSTVSLRAQDAINLNNATLSADLLKVRALGPNGQLTISGSSVLSGRTQLLFYAGGSNGTILFQNSTTLNTNGVAGILAASTITISNRQTVTVTGSVPLQVFTDNANYSGSGGNGSTSGAFAGSAAPTGKQPFASAPPFPSGVLQPGRPAQTGAVAGRGGTGVSARNPGKFNGTARTGPFNTPVSPAVPSRTVMSPSALPKPAISQTILLLPSRADRPATAGMLRP